MTVDTDTELQTQAQALVDGFDTAALAIPNLDRRAHYAALVALMTTFCKNSPAPETTIMSDFARRVFDGMNATADEKRGMN